MQDDVKNMDQTPEKKADHLIGRLQNLYAEYLEKNRKIEETNKSIAKLFEKWIRGYDSAASDSMHQDFLDGIEKIVSDLVPLLEEIQKDKPDLCSDLAERAVRRIMVPKSKSRPKTNAEWFMTVAEYQCAPLLPFLKLEIMEEIRGKMFVVPKRMMFPKEREFFEEFEAILKAKREQT